jgi:protein involved in polysaccharide export with SLBB domain
MTDNIIGMLFANSLYGKGLTPADLFVSPLNECGALMKNTAVKMWATALLCFICIFSFSCVKRVPPPSNTDKQTVVSKDEFLKLYAGQNTSAAKQRRAARTPILYPGDEISIAIYDKLPVSQDKRIEMKRIGDDGSIFILPVKEIFVGGLTVTEAEKTIEKKLSEFIVSPFCELTITKRAFEPRIYVLGEVMKPGVIPLKEGDRLVDAIAAVIGCKSDAYRRSIKVIRVNEQNVSMISINLYDIMNEGKVEYNILLQDQDIVFVPRRFLTNFNEVMGVLGQLVPWYYFYKSFTLP